MSNGEVVIIHLIVGLIKKTLRAGLKVELDLSHYATKSDLKNARGVDTSEFSKKADLANSKSNVDKLDIDK